MKNSKVTLALSLAGLLSSAVPAFAFRGTIYGNQQNQQNQQQRFRGMDRNGDGVITRDEWRGNDKSFRKHDRNGDGVLSGDELRGNGNSNGKGQRGQHGQGHHENDNDKD